MPLSRRTFLKMALGGAAAGAAATTGFAALSATLPPSERGFELQRARFFYVADDYAVRQKLWFTEKIGEETVLSDFNAPEQGASVSWNGRPALLFRVNRSKLKLPPGKITNRAGVEYGLAPLSGIESDIAAFWNICPHACCRMTITTQMGTYLPENVAPIWRDLFWCICHDYLADPHAIVQPWPTLLVSPWPDLGDAVRRWNPEKIVDGQLSPGWETALTRANSP